MLFSGEYKPTSDKCNIRIRRNDGLITCFKVIYKKVIESIDNSIILELLIQDAKSLANKQDKQALMVEFVSMMENTNDYIYFKDRNHVFTGASQTLVNLTNPSEHWTDLIGKTDYDVFPEEYADIYYNLEKQVFSGVSIAHETQETLDNSGKRGWVDNRKYPLLNEKKEIIGLFGIARDITETQQIQKTLKLSEKRFRTIFEESPLGVALIDSLNGHFYEVNRRYAEIAGRNLNEMASINWMSITHPNDIQEDLDNMAALNTGKINGFNMKKRLKKPDNTYIWIDLTVTRVTVEDENKPFHLAMIEDITEKMTAEKGATIFGRVLNSSSNEIFMFDSSTLYFTQVNSGACENLGYSMKEMTQLTPLDLKPEHTEKTFRKLIKPLREKKSFKSTF